MIKRMLFGLIIGGLVGLLIPVVMSAFYEAKSPGQGVGTVFAMMSTCTVPVGAVIGLFMGVFLGSE